jgi:hypothetical protein
MPKYFAADGFPVDLWFLPSWSKMPTELLSEPGIRFASCVSILSGLPDGLFLNQKSQFG